MAVASDIQGRATDHVLMDAIAGVANRFLGYVDVYAERHALNIHAAIDDFDQGAAVTAQTREAVRSTLVAFAVYVRESDLAPAVRVPSEATEYARAFVERRFPLKVLLRTYLLGQSELWRTWSSNVRAAGLDPDVERQVLERTHSQMLRFTEQLTVQIVDVFEVARERRARSMSAIRADVVRGLLEEEQIDVGEAERILRYALDSTHMAVVVWTPDADGRPSRQDHVWSALADRAAAPSRLAVPVGRNVLWAWFGGGAAEIRDVADRIDGWPLPVAGTCVACSEPLKGVTGFRAAHRQALQVRRVIESTARQPTVARRFNDVAIPALAGMDDAMARFFVEQHLGALAADDDAAARLRATLAVYLEEGESTSATAHRLGVHVNTVAYRLRQVAELLGRPPTQPRLETQLALRLVPYVAGVRGESESTSSITASGAPACT